jgi:hypothetical protein
LTKEEREAMEAGKGIHTPLIPGTFRPVANKDNDYLIDRRAQKDKRSYSGVFGFAVQDSSLQESMGAIQDHEAERLLPTDKAIVMARRKLLDALEGLENGIEPPALNVSAQHVRAAGVLLDRGTDPVEWAREHLADTRGQPVYTI